MQTRIDYIGNMRAPILVVEDAWPNPQGLIDIAAHRNDYSARSLYYPGLRSSAPPEYAQAMLAQLRELIHSTFALPDPIAITDSTFSLVATPLERLVPFQRVPHFDSTDPNRLAVLHYLCGPEHGGTSFYRHRSTGLEEITPDDHASYIRTVNAEVRTTGMPPPQFIDGDTTLFERIARYDAVFNRVLVYRGRFLHSVNVPPGFVADANPRTGRLTLNTFLLARADAQPQAN
ncbi:MAG TPA: DUF6445 family protein [Povalibacter sp.]|nr:DUF6445 family protein [Povalibacter sp.]